MLSEGRNAQDSNAAENAAKLKTEKSLLDLATWRDC